MIRPATRADCGAIAAIWNPIIRDTDLTFTTVEKTEAGLAQMLVDKARAGQPFLVAEVDAQVCGFASYGAFRSGPGYARTQEHTIILGAKARGLGLGRALMVALENEARSRGVHVLVAGIAGGNAQAIGFHTAIGFHKVGEMPEVGTKRGLWHNLILMQKLL